MFGVGGEEWGKRGKGKACCCRGISVGRVSFTSSLPCAWYFRRLGWDKEGLLSSPPLRELGRRQTSRKVTGDGAYIHFLNG